MDIAYIPMARGFVYLAAVVTVVAGRESDMYPAWASVSRLGFHLLRVRA
jgi:hypothetical protein